MRNLRIDGDRNPDIVRFRGIDVHQVRFNGIPVWVGVRFGANLPSTTFAAMPTTSNLLNPTQVQLNNMAVNQTARFTYNGTAVIGSGSIVSRTIPANRRLRFQLWGGGGAVSSGVGAVTGGYSSGELQFPNSVTPIFFSVGEQGYHHRPGSIPAGLVAGNPQASFLTPRTFGGGGGTWVHTGATIISGQGAGATDIRVLSNDIYHRIIVAGGAGGAGSATVTLPLAGSHIRGGGTNGGNGSSTAAGATQNGTNAWLNNQPGGFGLGGGVMTSQNGARSSGGGGWFGGRMNTGTASGEGGSGYVLLANTAKPEGYFADWPNWVLENAGSINPTGSHTTWGNGLILLTRLA